jgi:hypothetical protein
MRDNPHCWCPAGAAPTCLARMVYVFSEALREVEMVSSGVPAWQYHLQKV